MRALAAVLCSMLAAAAAGAQSTAQATAQCPQANGDAAASPGNAHALYGFATLSTTHLPVPGQDSQLRLDYANPHQELGAIMLAVAPAQGPYVLLGVPIRFEPAAFILSIPFTNANGTVVTLRIANDTGLCSAGFPLVFQAIMTDFAQPGTPHGFIGSNRVDWTVGACPDALVITEIMADPAAVQDGAGEWFEVLNTSACALDLAGWTIKDLGLEAHTIAVHVVVGPHAYAVFARNGSAAQNGGIAADYVYSGITLGDAADAIVLVAPDLTIVDAVVYAPGFPLVAGASLQLAPGAIDPLQNDFAGSWCASVVPFGAGDRGTPGASNLGCP